MTVAACQGIWLACLLGELKKEEPACVQLNINNKSTISLANNPMFHDRSKHIDVRHHFIRECVEARKVEVEFVGTNGQLADILTKALGVCASWRSVRRSARLKLTKVQALGGELLG